MEKRKLSGKTILKLVGALLALAYLGFCLYAGITGKFPNMHRAEHVMRFSDLKNWVSGGMSAVHFVPSPLWVLLKYYTTESIKTLKSITAPSFH